ncbi:hypothetical protein RHS03_01674, partial [Rhizoctonia solani]
MPLPVSAPCSAAPNCSSLPFNKNKSAKCLLRFSEGFLAPGDKITDWYNNHRARFHTVQYRKERTSIGHEFILALLEGEGGHITSYCRVERTGDPEHRLKSICFDGTMAEDYIHIIPSDNHETAGLKNSDIVAEIVFNSAYDLKDLLAVCYGISKHKRARKYTLQQYNCYFFSWTIILALTRACVKWDVSASELIPGYIHKIREDILSSIDEQGQDRFNLIAYVLSDDRRMPFPHNWGEDHPLDQHVKARLNSSDFAAGIDKVLKHIMWPDKLCSRLEIASLEGLGVQGLASESSHLLKETDNPHILPKQDNKLASTVQKAVCEAVVKGVDSYFKVVCKFMTNQYCANVAIIKHRVGRRELCKTLKAALLSSKTDGGGGELVDPQTMQEISSSIKNCVRFTPSSILPYFTTLAGGFFLSAKYSSMRAKVKYSPGPNEAKVVACYKGVLRFGSTIRHAILGLPTTLHFVKSMVDSAAIELTSKQEVTSEISSFGSLKMTLKHAYDDAWLVGGKTLIEAARSLDCNIKKLIRENEGCQLEFLRPCLLGALKSITELSVMMPFVNDETGIWAFILWQHFSEIITRVSSSYLTGLVDQSSKDPRFYMSLGKAHELEASAVSADPGHHHRQGETASVVRESLADIEIDKQDTKRRDSHPACSFDYLQSFIRKRISRLSRREAEFAPILKHVTLKLSSETCQKEIEDSIEEIWIQCRELITRPGESTEILHSSR